MVDNTTADLDFGTVMSDEELAASLEAEKTTPTEEPKQESTPEDDPLAPEQIEETPNEDDEEVDIPADEQEESNALKLKPKKKTAQERIDELTAARRAAEREAEDLRRQLAERSQPKEVETKEAVEAPAGPTPDDVDANGEAKYPLGEFDPGFIRDLTRFTLQQEREALRAQEAAERQAEQERSAVEEIQRGWQERLAVAEQTLPDIQEKGMALESTFEGLDPSYGTYLAQTIMSMEHGPEVLYYLSDHIEEAKALVAGGPLKATLGLGELNSMFKSRKTEPAVKVTKAPEPPVDRARGTNGRFDVADDTDDLDAFAKKFYGK